jgi:hypothetical protein
MTGDSEKILNLLTDFFPILEKRRSDLGIYMISKLDTEKCIKLCIELYVKG